MIIYFPKNTVHTSMRNNNLCVMPCDFFEKISAIFANKGEDNTILFHHPKPSFFEKDNKNMRFTSQEQPFIEKNQH